jgi:hypothetical protein
VLIVVLVLYARHGERFTRESAARRIGARCCSVCSASRSCGSRAPSGLQLGGTALRRVRGGCVEWAFESFSLGGTFLFMRAILVVMAPLPLRRLVDTERRVRVSPAVHLRVPYCPDASCATGARRSDIISRRSRGAEIPVRVGRRGITDQPNASRSASPDPPGDSLEHPARPPFAIAGACDRPRTGHHSHHHLWKLSAWFALVALPTAF